MRNDLAINTAVAVGAPLFISGDPGQLDLDVGSQILHLLGGESLFPRSTNPAIFSAMRPASFDPSRAPMVDLPTAPWYWNPDVRIALAPVRPSSSELPDYRELALLIPLSACKQLMDLSD
jgi:hypothetical protein